MPLWLDPLGTRSKTMGQEIGQSQESWATPSDSEDRYRQLRRQFPSSRRLAAAVQLLFEVTPIGMPVRRLDAPAQVFLFSLRYAGQ